MSFGSIPSNVSQIGLRRENIKGILAGGAYRGLCITGFNPGSEQGEFGMFDVVKGNKGTHAQNKSGSHREISFTTFANKADATSGSLIDLLHMIFDHDNFVDNTDGTADHLFKLSDVPASKKAWSFAHDDNFVDAGGDPQATEDQYRMFVISTLSIVIDKEAGTVVIDVSGMAAEKKINATTTIAFGTNPIGLWSARKSSITIGGVEIKSFKVLTMEFDCKTKVHNTINDTGFPEDINGDDLTLAVTLEGLFFNQSGGVVDGKDLRDAFVNHSEGEDSAPLGPIIIKVGNDATNDELTLTLPKWRIETEESQEIAPGEPLPQTVTLFPITDGDIATNGFTVLHKTVDTVTSLDDAGFAG